MPWKTDSVSAIRHGVSALAMTAILALAVSPAQAAGTVVVTTPPSVTPSATQLQGPNVDGAACAQQYTNYMHSLSAGALTTQTAGLTAEAAGLVIEATVVGSIPGIIAQGVGVATQIAGLGVAIVQETTSTAVDALPNCDSQFAGTIS